MLHAIDLRENAQRLTLLACCELILGRLDDALSHALRAHTLAPARVQTLCVLVDVLYTMGRGDQARRMLYIAVMRAQTEEDRLSVAVECAKHGEDSLTLRLTRSLLHRDPYSIRSMMIRGCALMNLRRFDEAKRVFARLCVILPEDTICLAYYAMARDEQTPEERLTLGLDVPRSEAVNRTMRIVAAMAQTSQDDVHELCQLSAWSFRSVIGGANTAVLSLMQMIALNTPETRDVLLDALTDPQVSDHLKYMILQAMTAAYGFKPYDADIGGRACAACGRRDNAAAGGWRRNSDGGSGRGGRAGTGFSSGAEMLLPMYIALLEQSGMPDRREQPACAAALEYLFHRLSGRKVDLRRIAAKNGVSPRLCRMMAKRILRAVKNMAKNKTKGSAEHEVHQL